MSYKVLSLPGFERQAKRLIKKYPSLKTELFELITELKNNPIKGTSIGNNCFKIRVSIKSKGKGKSGGSRVITHLVFKHESVYLLSIYDKSEIENLSDKEILELLKLIPE